jgi:hypothetical protein
LDGLAAEETAWSIVGLADLEVVDMEPPSLDFEDGWKE